MNRSTWDGVDLETVGRLLGYQSPEGVKIYQLTVNRGAQSPGGRVARPKENSEGQPLVAAGQKPDNERSIRMDTSQKAKGTKKSVKDNLFIVWDEEQPCGPDSEVLALSLRSKRDNPTFSWAGGSIGGKVVSMANMRLVQRLGDDIPLWEKNWDSEWWKLRFSDVTLCQGIQILHSEQAIGDIDMLYCSGPTAKDRWGIFTTGSMMAAIDEMKKGFCQTFQGMSDAEKEGVMVVPGSGKYYYSFFVRESPSSMEARVLKPIGFTSFDNKEDEDRWPHILVRLDFKTWTLSTKTSDVMGGKWEHKRIRFCPTEMDMIAGEAKAAFRSLLQKEKESLAAAAKKQGIGTGS